MSKIAPQKRSNNKNSKWRISKIKEWLFLYYSFVKNIHSLTKKNHLVFIATQFFIATIFISTVFIAKVFIATVFYRSFSFSIAIYLSTRYHMWPFWGNCLRFWDNIAWTTVEISGKNEISNDRAFKATSYFEISNFNMWPV